MLEKAHFFTIYFLRTYQFMFPLALLPFTSVILFENKMLFNLFLTFVAHIRIFMD